MDIGEMIGDDAYLFWEEQRGNLLRSVRFAAHHEHGKQLQGNINKARTYVNKYIKRKYMNTANNCKQKMSIISGPLRALGLLLADGAPTVGWGKTFWRVGRVPLTKTDVTRKRKVAQ